MSHARGLTLIELLIALVVVALLAACAVPTHRASVLRTRRTDARIALLQLQTLQERHAFQHGRYAASLAELGDAAGLARSAEGFYAMSLEGRDEGRGFVARAVPMAGGPQQSDRDCRSFELDEAGRRSAEGSADAARRCWS